MYADRDCTRLLPSPPTRFRPRRTLRTPRHCSSPELSCVNVSMRPPETRLKPPWSLPTHRPCACRAPAKAPRDVPGRLLSCRSSMLVLVNAKPILPCRPRSDRHPPAQRTRDCQASPFASGEVLKPEFRHLGCDGFTDAGRLHARAMRHAIALRQMPRTANPRITVIRFPRFFIASSDTRSDRSVRPWSGR